MIVYDKIATESLADNDTKALKMSEERIRDNTVHASIYRTASYISYANKDYKKCYQYAKRAVSIRPWESASWHNLTECAFKLQKWPDANKAFRHKIVLRKITIYDVFQLGVTYMYLHQYDKAYALFKKTEEMDPEYVKYTKMYTSYIEKEKPESMTLVGQDIYKISGTLKYSFQKVAER